MRKMVASTTLELPYYKTIERQRGPGFGSLAQHILRTAIPFLRKDIVPAENRMGADLSDFAGLEFADVVTGKQISKLLLKALEDRH